jgi:hypothetical protein
MTYDVSPLCELLRSRWWAASFIKIAIMVSDGDTNTPPADHGSKSPLLLKHKEQLNNERLLHYLCNERS